jgi:hypothetical protein
MQQQRKTDNNATATPPAKAEFHIQFTFVLIGAVVGFMMEAASTFVSLEILRQSQSRQWEGGSRNATSTTGEIISQQHKPSKHWDLYLYVLILVSIKVIYLAIWFGLAFSFTRRGAFYFANKFDRVSIRSVQISFPVGIFLGSCFGLLLVDSSDVLSFSLTTFCTACSLLLFSFNIDWAKNNDRQPQEEEAKESLC